MVVVKLHCIINILLGIRTIKNMDTFYMDKRFQNMGRYVYCKSCYLRVRKIYTSYTVSFKLRKISSRVKVKKKTKL